MPRSTYFEMTLIERRIRLIRHSALNQSLTYFLELYASLSEFLPFCIRLRDSEPPEIGRITFIFTAFRLLDGGMPQS